MAAQQSAFRPSLSRILLGLAGVFFLSIAWSSRSGGAGLSALVDVLVPTAIGSFIVSVGLLGGAEVRVKTLVASVSTIVSLVVADVALVKLLTPVVLDPPRAPLLDMDRMIESLAKDGIDAYPRYGAHLFETVLGRKGIAASEAPVMPLAGVSGSMLLHEDEVCCWNSFRLDEHGFNNDAGAHRSSPDLVVLVGDSFAAGAGVGREDNVATNLARRAGKVLNLGISGNGPLAEYAILREYGLPLRPRDVVWVYFEGNDLADLGRELASPIASYLDEGHSQGLRDRQDEVDSFLGPTLKTLRAETWCPPEQARLAARQAYRLRKVRNLLRAATGTATTQEVPDSRFFCHLLGRVARDVSAAGGRLWFVYMPAADRFHPSRMVRARIDALHDPVKEWILSCLKGAGVTTLDLLAAMREESDPRAFYPTAPPTGHLNAAGYRFAADRIEAMMKQGERESP
jgi:lysophospholipase L1-like esterase